MAPRKWFGRWFPENPPSWWDVLGAASALLLLISLVLGPLQLDAFWVGVGAVAGALTLGPLANSKLGAVVGSWFRGIGLAGRGAVILSWVVTTWLAYRYVDVPWRVVSNVVVGWIAATLGFYIVHLVRAGEIDGW